MVGLLSGIVLLLSETILQEMKMPTALSASGRFGFKNLISKVDAQVKLFKLNHIFPLFLEGVWKRTGLRM